MSSSLVITPFAPNGCSGRGKRTTAIIRALAQTGEVEVVYVDFEGSKPDQSVVDHPHVALRKVHPSRGPKRALLYARARRHGVPRDFARGVSVELCEALSHAVSNGHSRVIADGPSVAATLVLLPAATGRVVYNAHNFESWLRAQLGWTGGALEELRRFEQQVFESARESWLPSGRDLRAAASLAPRAQFRLVPNVVDVASITPVSSSANERLLFVADYSYEPNLNSALFLTEEVMPRVWVRLPEARLALAGKGLELDRKLDPRIELLGFVDELDEVYASAGCVVVPLLESGGSPLKLIEAMAYGLPIVATPSAAAGVDGLEKNIHYLEGTGGDEFAAAVVEVLSGEPREPGVAHMRVAARTLAENHYSIEALARQLSE